MGIWELGPPFIPSRALFGANLRGDVWSFRCRAWREREAMVAGMERVCVDVKLLVSRGALNALQQAISMPIFAVCDVLAEKW